MAAGHAAFFSEPTVSLSKSFSSSLFPSSTTRLTCGTGLKLPVVRVLRAALVVSPKIVRETSVVSVRHVESPLAWSFQNLGIREDKVDKDADEKIGTVRSKSNKRETVYDDVERSQIDLTAKLPWMDPSLRYANVMWFQGAYNAQILVSPGESEDSIVRRFRHAVAGAGVLRECYRRRYRETPRDVIKRKQKQAALQRKRRRQYESKSSCAYEFPKESSSRSKKNKTKKETRSHAGYDAGKNGTTGSKANDIDDDDYWGYTEKNDHR